MIKKITKEELETYFSSEIELFKYCFENKNIEKLTENNFDDSCKDIKLKMDVFISFFDDVKEIMKSLPDNLSNSSFEELFTDRKINLDEYPNLDKNDITKDD